MTNRTSRVWKWSVCLPVVGASLAVTTLVVRAADVDSPWSEPIVVFRTTGLAARPVLTADAQGDVHLFFAFGGTSGQPARALMYARLHGASWSDPVEVLATPKGGTLNFPAATSDGRGLLHVLWQGGPLNRIYYSSAAVAEAASPNRWSATRPLSEGGAFGGGLGSDIVTGPDDSLHVLYASLGGNVYYRRSTDAGNRWSESVRVSQVGTSEATDYPRVAVDESGCLHATWTQFRLPNGWPPTGGFYSQSVDGGQTWSPPLEVAGENYGIVNVAAVGADRVHLVWNAVIRIGDRLHQWSSDGGRSWSDVHRIILDLKGGFTGYPAVAIDAAGTLHLATGLDGAAGKQGGIYYLMWREHDWTDPSPISQGAVGKTAVDSPSVTVSGGNHLHVVYADDSERIWYTSRIADAPSNPPRQFSTTDHGHPSSQSWYPLGRLGIAVPLIAAVILIFRRFFSRPAR